MTAITQQGDFLSKRTKQPGNCRSFVKSEDELVSTLETFLDPNIFKVEDKPNELRKMFAGYSGIVPDAKVTHLPSNKVIYFEVKTQGDQGNAEERAYKNHTSQFQKIIKEKLGLPYHPFVVIFCGRLAENTRYIRKFEYYIEPYHFLLWKNFDKKVLWEYIRRIFNDWFSEDIGNYPVPDVQEETGD